MIVVNDSCNGMLVRLPGGQYAARRFPCAEPSQATRLGKALIVADGNFARGHRPNRRGARHGVDGYRAVNVKQPQVSQHALRQTSATLAYRYTCDLRAVHDMLRHQDPKITAPLCARGRSSSERACTQGAGRTVAS